MNSQKISRTEKTCHLISSIGSDSARMLATQAAGSEMDYDHVVAVLRERYERKRVLFSQHHQSMLQHRKVGYNHHDLLSISQHAKADRRDLELCGAYTADQMQASLIESSFDDEVKSRWTLYSELCKDPPTMEKILDFIDRQLVTLPEIPVRQKASVNTPAKSGSFQQRSGKALAVRSQEPRAEKCPVCKEEHRIYKCLTFKGWDYPRKMRCVHNHHLCYNCLSVGHSALSCPSSRTYRECRENHHTLIHPVQKETPVSSVTPNGSSARSPFQRNFLHLLGQFKPGHAVRLQGSSSMMGRRYL